MTTTRRLLSLTIGLLACGWATAGPLDPPATPPAPTMATNQQIYDRLRAPSDTCLEDTGALRFVDCATTSVGTSNGTVKDLQTGLIYLENANCFGPQSWANANIKAAALASGQCGLTDGSKAGDWRLPTIEELQALSYAYPSACNPSLPAASGTGCYSTGPWATGVQLGYYWTSSTLVGTPSNAWALSLFDGRILGPNKFTTYHPWPVRDGP